MNQQNQTWNHNAQACGQQLTDQEMAFDLLYQEKSLLSNIASEVLEASQPGMRQVLNDCYMQIGQDQLSIFNAMEQQGWYPLEAAEAEDVQTTMQK